MAHQPSDCRHGPKPKPPSDREFKPPSATFPTNYQDDEREFIVAMDRYKREKSRPFPTWSEVLHVLKSLGYVKPAAVVSMDYLEAIARKSKGLPGGRPGMYLKPKPKIRFEKESK